MMRFLCAAGIATAAFALEQAPARAYEAPWCAVVETGVGSVYWDCQYRSVEECAPHVIAGNRGHCIPNPYYPGNPFAQSPAAPRKHNARRRHRAQQ
jgi:hypothetical protein